MQHRAEYCASKAEEAGAADIYLSQMREERWPSRLGNLYHSTFDTVREGGHLVNGVKVVGIRNVRRQRD